MANLTDKQLEEKALGPFGRKFIEGPHYGGRAWIRPEILARRRAHRKEADLWFLMDFLKKGPRNEELLEERNARIQRYFKGREKERPQTGTNGRRHRGAGTHRRTS